MRRAPVSFEPSGMSADVELGMTLLDAASEAGVVIPAPCGGRGTCGKCAVRVLDGTLDHPVDLESTALRKVRDGIRLACLAKVGGPVTVRPLGASSLGALEKGAAATAGWDRRVAPTAAAVDLGTTTITATMVDRDSGRAGLTAMRANPQSAFGSDVASRLAASLEGEGDRLARTVREAIAHVLGDAWTESGARSDGVRRIVIAANVAMSHLLVGADVRGLAEHPYRPSWDGPYKARASDLGFVGSGVHTGLAPDAEVYVLPAFGAFVGGDLVGGVLSTSIDRSRGPSLLLDLGTNAEVALALEGRLMVASAPAGPAFEASGIACGGPAAFGAAESVRSGPNGPILTTAHGEDPSWLCGSGLLEAVMMLVDLGHVDTSGRMCPEGPLSDRFHDRDGILTVQLAGERDALGDVHLSQLDVRTVQLAKAAVAVAIDAVLEAAGIGWRDVSRFCVAGAFGRALRKGTMPALGIVPAGAGPVEEFVGNAALAGAVRVAADPGEEARAEALARRAEILDLPASGMFRQRLVAATEFPARRHPPG